MNRALVLLLCGIFVAQVVRCSEDPYLLGKKALMSAVEQALPTEGHYYKPSNVQYSIGLVSREWLNEKFIEKTIKPMISKDANEKGCILFCPSEKIASDRSAEWVMARKYDLSTGQWTDVRDTKYPTKDVVLNIYFVPMGEQVSLNYHSDAIKHFIDQRKPLIVCFEEKIARETILFFCNAIKILLNILDDDPRHSKSGSSVNNNKLPHKADVDELPTSWKTVAWAELQRLRNWFDSPAAALTIILLVGAWHYGRQNK